MSIRSCCISLLLGFTLAALLWPVAAFGSTPPSSPPDTQQSSPVQSDLERAYAFGKEGKLEEALGLFQSALERDPGNQAVRAELGYTYARLRRWSEAASAFEAVVKSQPENWQLRMDLGYALQNLGDLDGAAKQFETVAGSQSPLSETARRSLEAVRQLQQDKTAAALSRRDAFLNRGYELLRQGNRAAARQQFELAAREDPGDVRTLKQLGYMSLEDRDLAAAVSSFEAARSHAGKDYGLALQLGFIYDALHQPAKAKDAFSAAVQSPDQPVRTEARTALRNLAWQTKRWYLDVFASPLYLSRFEDGIAMFQTRLGFRPTPQSPVSFYFGSRITRDTRSEGGAFPIIFADNYALFGLGVLVQPGRSHLSLYAEANLATPLISAANLPTARSDFRTVLAYYRRWDGALWGPLGWAAAGSLRSERMFSDVDSSLGFYSRYRNNGIFYLQMREGVRVFRSGGTELLAYARYNLVKDTHKDFYNNLGEVGPGLEFRPVRTHNLGVRLEFFRGAYFGIENEPRPYGANYNDVRISLVFGHRF